MPHSSPNWLPARHRMTWPAYQRCMMFNGRRRALVRRLDRWEFPPSQTSLSINPYIPSFHTACPPSTPLSIMVRPGPSSGSTPLIPPPSTHRIKPSQTYIQRSGPIPTFVTSQNSD
ncbi:hypothetical protein B0H67DRAFT_577308 [Lasiosphaeris hirsuta]|uniref:Uncharacterized protein n=1 Tax=Lasiosphaeris hirsuta TaxID=260670 RepID=A0AA40ARR3_9PEZI|nr:hypothetical protein B0H67DRAFT_577308 [Lasiosphaeris hirsuta]